ncbi:MAG: helix-turn-helix transcriptional regulator [Flavobacterium sp.]|nr:helix-turn-helix transcriptional regulator [Flavobacterium sp.]
MNTTTIKQFYENFFGADCPDLNSIISENIHKDIGHFNVFDIAEMYKSFKSKLEMPYNRRTYYKISLISGQNKVEFADKTILIKDCGILFASPKIPYNYTPLNLEQSGHFCVFTKDFLAKSKIGLDIDHLPIFSLQSDFIYQITPEQFEEVNAVFLKMHTEIASDYEYKYDLLRNYLMELIHYGQKLKPILAVENVKTASARITALFIELLERQFPIENTTQVLLLKSPVDYADTLGVHVNHLNKVLKETTGKTTSEIIASRMNQEAKVLLKQTQWNVSEIAYTLGFEEIAHFSNFFKKHNQQSPLQFRE